MRMIVGALALLAVSGPASAQHQPYAGLESRAIKTLSDQQVADLNAGSGMGLALAAELNGYPGPMHAIELAERLGLSPDQVAKLKGLFDTMKAETVPIGMTLVSQERALNEDFARKTVTPASLEANTQKIGATQAALRAAHLKYHLATADILTADQVKRYNALRGYTNNAMPQRHHGMQHN
jgi:Spy/CpxP family protein refolding chaperone